MAVTMEILAETVLDEIGVVVANDSTQSSFSVSSGDSLLALDRNLAVTGRWPADPEHWGCHATAPGRGLALLSNVDDVCLLDRESRVLWRYPHTTWAGDFESGCTWFDQVGEPIAVVPAENYESCLVLRFDLESGRVLARAPIAAAPAGVEPVHHPDGWVGLSVGEGQDAVRAWWVRSARQPGGDVQIEMLAAGWDDEILCDVSPSGRRILTAAHTEGPLLVRSFPALSPLRAIEAPALADPWRPPACFIGDMVLACLVGSRPGLVAIGEDDTAHVLDDQICNWLISAGRGTWLTATATRIRHGKIRGRPGGGPGRPGS